jgi:hypothetical protein
VCPWVNFTRIEGRSGGILKFKILVEAGRVSEKIIPY